MVVIAVVIGDSEGCFQEFPVRARRREVYEIMATNHQSPPGSGEPVDFITLLGGLTVARPALEVLIDLEQRGFRFTRPPEGGLAVSPRADLTDDDRSAIRRWRFHLEALIAYEPPEQQVH